MTDKVQIQDSAAVPEQEAPAPKEVSTFRLMATLTVAGALAGLLIVMVNQHTKPIIDKYKAEQLQKAVYEVLPGIERYSTYYLVDGALSLLLPEGAKSRKGLPCTKHLESTSAAITWCAAKIAIIRIENTKCLIIISAK